MGDLVDLSARRSGRAARGREVPVHAPARAASATFFFDLASPWTYFAAERVDRLLPSAAWAPAPSEVLHRGGPPVELGREAAVGRAQELRMPLVWPERPWGTSYVPVAAMRIAALAAAQGRAAPFVLAASRLAFCGGFDLDDVETLTEAAAAASLPLQDCLAAAGDPALDPPMESDAKRLLARGADRLPVIQVGRTLFCGEEQVAQAAAAAVRAGGARRQAL